MMFRKEFVITSWGKMCDHCGVRLPKDAAIWFRSEAPDYWCYSCMERVMNLMCGQRVEL